MSSAQPSLATPERRVVKLKLPSSNLRALSSRSASAGARSLHSSISSMPKFSPTVHHKQAELRTCKECSSRERPELFLAINLMSNNDYRDKCFTCRRLDSVTEWTKNQRKAGIKLSLSSQNLHIQTHVEVCKKWQAKLQGHGFTITDEYIDSVIAAVSKHAALQHVTKEAPYVKPFDSDRMLRSRRQEEPRIFKTRLESTAQELRCIAEMLDGAAHLTEEAADWVMDVDYLSSVPSWGQKVRERLKIAAGSDFRFNLVAANDKPGVTDHLGPEDKDAVRTLCSLGMARHHE